MRDHIFKAAWMVLKSRDYCIAVVELEIPKILTGSDMWILLFREYD